MSLGHIIIHKGTINKTAIKRYAFEKELSITTAVKKTNIVYNRKHNPLNSPM